MCGLINRKASSRRASVQPEWGKAMTEAEWLASDDPARMLTFIGDWLGNKRRKAGRRKLRLFGCACARQLWPQMTDPRSRHAVEVAERLADGQASAHEVEHASADAGAAETEITFRRLVGGRECQETVPGGEWLEDDERMAALGACRVLSSHVGQFAYAGRVVTYGEASPEYPVFRIRCSWQAAALRCVFGNPFRPVVVEPAWRTREALALAASIYEERAYDCLPILADALEEAGCTDADVLGHCRQPGEHVRGCWVVDLIRGNSRASPEKEWHSLLSVL
jgi:hypothetical protein